MRSHMWCFVVGVLVVVGSMATQAAQFGDFAHEFSGSSVNITKYNGPGGDVIIPDTIAGRPVTSIGDGAFFGCTGLTGVVIGNSVTRIWEGVFSGCTSLSSLFCNRPPPSIVVIYYWFDVPKTATVYYLPGTTGWGSTFGGRPTVLWNPLLSAQGVQMDGFRIGVTGTADIPIVVEASKELLGSDWTPLYSGTLTDGSLDVPDPDWADHQSRFYRVRSP